MLTVAETRDQVYRLQRAQHRAFLRREAIRRGMDSLRVDGPVAAAYVLWFYARRIAALAEPQPAEDLPQCVRTACEADITGEPTYDTGDQDWLPKSQWRTWCSTDCHEADSESYWTRSREETHPSIRPGLTS